MGRPRNALDVTQEECKRIRALWLQGVRVLDIVRRTGRCESVIYRAVRGMRRPRPWPAPRVTKRNELIVKRVLEDGVAQAVVARRFHVAATTVCKVVQVALGLRAGRVPKPGEHRWRVVKKAPPSLYGKLVKPPATRAQLSRRDREIFRRAIVEGASLAAVARRYGISTALVSKIVTKRLSITAL